VERHEPGFSLGSSYSCAPGTWEIEPQEVATASSPPSRSGLGPNVAEHVAGGWPWIISGLKTLLETGEPLAG